MTEKATRLAANKVLKTKGMKRKKHKKDPKMIEKTIEKRRAKNRIAKASKRKNRGK